MSPCLVSGPIYALKVSFVEFTHRSGLATFATVFCVIDIESSGGKYGQEAMIEIAAFRYDGTEVVDQLVSLVHPHRPVQAFVQKMTGITPKMLQRAPRFHELAKRLIEITEDAVIVGHNVPFDYRMLRQEFERLGYPYERDTLDTIKLAEELLPDMESYGLSKLCDALGLYRKDKHRAESDARATLELFEILRSKDRQKKISIFEQSVQSNDRLKDKLKDFQTMIKARRGTFYIHDAQGQLLYLGASDNIPAAVNRLFMADTERAAKLREESHSVRSEATGNWLVARIKRNEEMAEAKPRYGKPHTPRFQHALIARGKGAQAELQLVPLEKLGKRLPLLQTEQNRAGWRALRHFNGFKPERRQAIIEWLEAPPEQALVGGAGRFRGEGTAFIVEEGHLLGYRFFKLNQQWQDREKLRQNMTPVSPQAAYDHWLKLGLLAGDFGSWRKKLQ